MKEEMNHEQVIGAFVVIGCIVAVIVIVLVGWISGYIYVS